MLRIILIPVVVLALACHLFGAEVVVRDGEALRAALRRAGPGTTIKIAPGKYGNGYWVEKIAGTKDQPVVIAGADGDNPPVFEGGTEAWHFAACNHLVLRDIKVGGCTGNGINVDDGGNIGTPSRGMVIENVVIENIGPKGNFDGLKLSGLDEFVVRRCVISGWGGSAIDMVGCHDGVIEHCRIIGKDGYSQDTGIQAKGGCERVRIEGNFFHRAGQRAVNLGGSTGLAFFRPAVRDFEAKDIEVTGNHIVGSIAPIAFTTSVKCRVSHNTIVNPEKWIMRILQEQPVEKFQPCRDGKFEDNLIVYDRRVQVFVNVGPNTKPESFVLRGNAWFCRDGERRPVLPVAESGGIHQVDPMLEDEESPGMKRRSSDPRLRDVGAQATGK